MLEPQHHIVRIADHDHVARSPVRPPVLHPKIEEVGRQAFPDSSPSSKLRLDAKVVIHVGVNPLLAAKRAFRRLHRDVR